MARRLDGRCLFGQNLWECFPYLFRLILKRHPNKQLFDVPVEARREVGAHVDVEGSDLDAVMPVPATATVQERTGQQKVSV